MTEPVGQGSTRTRGRSRRVGRATVSVDTLPADPLLRKDEFEVRPVSAGPGTIAMVRRLLPLTILPAGGIVMQARSGSFSTAVTTVLVALPLLGVAILLGIRGLMIDRLYMTPTVVGEINPLTGRPREVDRAAIVRLVKVAVEPIAPPFFHFLLFLDATGRCRFRVDIGNYDWEKVGDYAAALGVPFELSPLMKAKAAYRKWPGGIPWLVGRAGVAVAIGTVPMVIGMLVYIAITGGSGSSGG